VKKVIFTFLLFLTQKKILMKKGLLYFVPMLLIVAMVACGGEGSKQVEQPNHTPQTTNTAKKSISKKLSAADFKAQIAKLPNETIVDVRTAGEIRTTGKIPNAIVVDFYGDNFDATMDKFKKDEPIMVYCKSGGRSGKTASLLQKKGFTEVYDLAGGMGAWLKNSFDIEKENATKK